jgi:hypothetical protein
MNVPPSPPFSIPRRLEKPFAWFIPSSAEKLNKETKPGEEDKEKFNNTQNKASFMTTALPMTQNSFL